MNKLTIIAAAVGALCFAGSASAQALKGPIDDAGIIAVGFVEGALAVHDAGAGKLS